ncbi:lanthionine synthetase LanC family protein [Chryseobacterium sp.]|uniref:lanthionine synthetase LanC family protein n=1 Tax=Chryseobacterium sp. TaxID=1871047 RepID=UPI0031CE2D95
MKLKYNEYRSAILDVSFQDLQDIVKNNRQVLEEEYLVADNIENIEFGITGYIRYLLECYKMNKEQRILDKIKELSLCLIDYCNHTFTINYSLYTGRSGVAYLLMELYEIHPDPIYLENCLKILKDSENAFFYSEYTSDYLMDGRAGVLYLLLFVFRRYGFSEIGELTDKYLNKILDNGILTSNGLSWVAKEEINIENSCDFARGASGIMFVLKYLSSISKENGFDFYTKQTEKYIENFIENGEECISLETYTFIPALEKKHILRTNSDKKNYVRILDILSAVSTPEELENTLDLLMILSPSVSNSFSGMVYDCNGIDAASITHESREHSLNEYAELIPGFLHGKTGAAYVNLRNITSAHAHNHSENQSHYFPKKPFPKEDFIFQKQYPKFYNLTKTNFPDIYSGVLKNINEYKSSFTDSIIPVLEKDYSSELLKDLLLFEENKNIFYRRMLKKNNLMRFSEIISYRNIVFDQVEALGNNIMDLPIRLSSNGMVINTKWEWSSNNIYQHSLNIIQPSALYTTVLTLTYDSSKNYITESPLKMEGLLLQAFEMPKTLRTAVEEFRYFCRSQSEDQLAAIIAYTYSRDKDELFSRLDYLVTTTVKNFLYNGCLEFV